MTGEIPFDAVPAKLATFDVCLLPLREIDFAYYCSPIQVFDYLAAGKPVVSTPVGQLEGWGGLVHIVRGVDAFSRRMETALGERTSPTRHRAPRVCLAQQWDVRVGRSSSPSSDLAYHLHLRGIVGDRSMNFRLISHVNRDDDLIEAWLQHYLELGVAIVSSDLPTAGASRTKPLRVRATAIRCRSWTLFRSLRSVRETRSSRVGIGNAPRRLDRPRGQR